MVQLLDPLPGTHDERWRATPGPEQGVIEEARRRHRRRRLGVAAGLGVIAAAIVGTLAAGLAGSGPSHSPRAGRHPSAFLHTRAGSRSAIAISPALDAGMAGWCIRLEDGGGCGALPTHGSPIFGASIFGAPGNFPYVKLFGPPRGPREITFTISSVAYVSLPGGKFVATRGSGLPYGYRIVSVPGAKYSNVRLLAFDSHRRLIGRQYGEATRPAPRVHYWKWPQNRPAGPCQIAAAGLPALQPKWGDVASQAVRYQGVVGAAPESCVDIEYYLQGWPLEAAVLLSAEHPGAAPGPLPNMKPYPGAPGVFDAPGAFPQEGMTAERLPDAWLVVAGGKGASQRLEVLRHLHATIRL